MKKTRHLVSKNVLLQETQVEEDNIMSNKEYWYSIDKPQCQLHRNDYISLEETINKNL